MPIITTMSRTSTYRLVTTLPKVLEVKSTILFGLIASAWLMLIGCESSGPIKGQKVPSTEVALTSVANRQLSQTRAVGRVFTDGTTNRSAEVLLDGDLHPYTKLVVNTDSAYTTLYGTFRRFLPGTLSSLIDDNEGNRATILFPSVDSFSLTDVIPASKIANGNQPVIVSWTGATGATTYVVAAVRRTLAYTGKGFSQYASSSSTSETLNQLAFYQTDGVNPDTGMYDIYVYAIAGVPDSASTAKVLPVPLPQQKADNLSLRNLTGHYGSIMVTRRDSMRIAIQP